MLAVVLNGGTIFMTLSTKDLAAKKRKKILHKLQNHSDIGLRFKKWLEKNEIEMCDYPVVKKALIAFCNDIEDMGENMRQTAKWADNSPYTVYEAVAEAYCKTKGTLLFP